MPRYFFHTHIGADVIADPAGVALRDPDAAWEAAHATIRAALRAATDHARLMSAVLVVTDADGAVVLEVPFGEAVDLPPAGSPTTH